MATDCWACGDSQIDPETGLDGAPVCSRCRRRWDSMLRHPSMVPTFGTVATAPFPVLAVPALARN